MKFLKIFSSMFIATAMCCFISGCSDDDDNNEPANNPVAESISVSPASVTFDVLGTAQTVTVTANAAWSVDVPDWVSASPASGSANAEVKLTAENNYSVDGSESRSDVVIFCLDSGEGDASVSVTQDGNEAGEPEPEPEPEPDPETETLSVSPTELSFENAGGEGTLTVTATGAWTVSGAPEWVTLSAESGDADATVTVTADSNYSESGSESRTGALTFTLTSGEADDVTVTLTQEGNEAAITYKEVVYFYDDFQWLVSYGEAVNQPDCVALGNTITDENGHTFSNYYISKSTVDGVTCSDDLAKRGYSFYLNSGSADTYVVIMPGYLYMYANNASHIGEMHLPKLETVPAEDAIVYIDFSWCPGCSTKVVLNAIELNVIVKNGEDETLFDVGGSDATDYNLCWTSKHIELANVTFTEETEIIFRPTEKYWTDTSGNNQCWFISGEGFKIYGLEPDID